MTKIRMQTANEHQVGGDHYRRGDAKTQHWDLMTAAKAGYFAGVVTKYVERHDKKAGRRDLEKSVHYSEKWVEVGGSKSQLGWWGRARVRDLIAAYAVDAGLTALQERIFEYALLEPRHPEKTLELCRMHLEREYPGESIPSLSEMIESHVATEPNRSGTPEDGGHHAIQNDLEDSLLAALADMDEAFQESEPEVKTKRKSVK